MRILYGVVGEGMGCFSKVIEQVAIYCERNGVPGDPNEIAVRLWTFVHGGALMLRYDPRTTAIDVPGGGAPIEIEYDGRRSGRWAGIRSVLDRELTKVMSRVPTNQ